MSFQTSALILSWVAIALLALVVSGLVRQVQVLSSTAVRRPEAIGLPPGTPAPGYRRLAPQSPATLALLFLQPGCGTCAELLDEAARRKDLEGLEFRVLYRDAAAPEAADANLVAFGDQAELFESYDVIATPFAVLIDPAGRVQRSEPVGSRDALRRLLAGAQVAPIAQATNRRGAP
jgi:hypothetical protein